MHALIKIKNPRDTAVVNVVNLAYDDNANTLTLESDHTTYVFRKMYYWDANKLIGELYRDGKVNLTDYTAEEVSTSYNRSSQTGQNHRGNFDDQAIDEPVEDSTAKYRGCLEIRLDENGHLL
jgi:hypothetical protein